MLSAAIVFPPALQAGAIHGRILTTAIFTRPDSLDQFTLPKPPTGSHTIRVRHPRFGELRRKVTMPSRGDLSVALTY